MSIQTIDNRNTKTEETKQANYRLPIDLLADLEEIASQNQIAQTIIVREAVREKINEYKQTGKLILSLEK